MRNDLEDNPDISLLNSECVHYWLIESPEGPTSRGVCKFCGAEKEFNNKVPRLPFSTKLKFDK
jgi:hypothetical protein